MFNKKLLPVLITIALVAGFAGGVFYSRPKLADEVIVQKLINQDTGKIQNVDFSEFWKVWKLLEEKYVDQGKLDTQQMVYGAIQGMVNAIGDPYTMFFEPDTSKKFQEEIAGAFGGVGMELGFKNDTLTVIAPIKDTPAFKAGIKSGDRIVKIDGNSTAGMTVDEAVSKIRGKPGTKVTLTIAPPANGTIRDITLTREIIKVPAVDWKIIEHDGKNTAYIQIYTFSQNVDSDFKKASDEILKSNTDSIILDLRNNPGGLLDSAINLAGYFVDKGQLVVSEVFGDGTKNDFKADGASQLAKYPILVLVNGGSASASEILAGALHDNKQIHLIGEKTFGKGSVQQLEELAGGASLKITVAKWYTPAGINISVAGINPDIKVELSDKDKESLIIGDPTKDPQLQKALDILN
ncbi:MAG: hypothetical protein A3I39_03295 [Candidatus Yanofskybacteria bacterium RIFCSPLOWO2_02_FULL_47_9b]|uniref:PDZ domain-containing protein n=1 Tax=Candidatus Yanofskybacteria bacterium RIFCSPLOWO2_02_FULL_47_9b TaxID=1802708 RepID=A0A1F8HB82_9BACT|nr:MAG: hypothetical protein A3I39_03295 [Candidatus Yanofskybacteria bacterium RIFCSPLOWO2_02_FULL_47_9b]